VGGRFVDGVVGASAINDECVVDDVVRQARERVADRALLVQHWNDRGYAHVLIRAAPTGGLKPTLRPGSQWIKVFWFFFSKENSFLS
jgi:hypothetical protein